MSFFLYSNILWLDLQNGQIFMFTGMLKVLPNDDSLATILGHEMSHAILQHAVSFFFFFLRHTCTWNYVLQVLLSGLLSITSTILLLPVELLWVLKHLLIFKSWTQVNTTQSNRKFTTIKKF